MARYTDSQLNAMADMTIPDEHFAFDAQLLRDQVFSTDRMLRVKQEIFENHRVSGTPLADHLVRCMDLSGSEDLLDLGCGNGVQLKLFSPLTSGRLVGLDLAPGVLQAAEELLAGVERVELVTSSADDLAMFDSASFDRVMSNYALHYVPDIDRCVREVARVLRPGGRFVVTTNSTRSMIEMYDVHFRALREVGAPAHLFKASPKGRISLDNGSSLLSPHFAQVDIVERPDVLEFEDVAPFMRFYTLGHNHCSASTQRDPGLDAAFFARLESAVADLVSAHIERSGRFRITKLTGSFVCRS